MAIFIEYNRMTFDEARLYYLKYANEWNSSTFSCDNGDIMIPKQWKTEEGDPIIEGINDYDVNIN